jgi:hypothetical protein
MTRMVQYAGVKNQESRVSAVHARFLAFAEVRIVGVKDAAVQRTNSQLEISIEIIKSPLETSAIVVDKG